MKLSIQTLFPTGNYLNKKYGIEMDFPDDSHPAENFKYLNEIVTSIHMAEFPSLYKDGKPLYSNYSGEEPTEVQVKDQPVSDEISSTIAELEKCMTLDELKAFWLICKGNLALSLEYKKREKQLTHAQ